MTDPVRVFSLERWRVLLIIEGFIFVTSLLKSLIEEYCDNPLPHFRGLVALEFTGGLPEYMSRDDTKRRTGNDGL